MTTASDVVNLAIIGCGGMGNRHLQGLAEYARSVAGLPGHAIFNLIAVSDPNTKNAALLADTALAEFGHRPAIFANPQAMFDAEPEIDAVDITTEPRLHESLSVLCLRAGKHVLVEKPMALTVAGCNAMMAASHSANRVLAVAENYRFDPLVRLTKALLDAKAIGDPWMVVDASIGSGGQIIITPWRHKRLYGGILLDVGVHNVDLMRYYAGPVLEVSARVALLDRVRKGLRPQGGGTGAPASPGAIYAITNANSGMPDTMEPDVEDTAFSTLRFEGGMIGQWTLSHAGHAQGFGRKQYWGSEGSMEPAPPRSGTGPRIWRDGSSDPLAPDEMLARVPDFTVDASTARLFGGERMASYHLDPVAIDCKIEAAVLSDFGRAIVTGTQPEVGGIEGRHAVAVVNALFESSHLNVPVLVADVEADVPGVSAWQHAIDRDLAGG